MAEPAARGFWTSLPGMLTALATVITALTGAWLAFSHGRKNVPAAVVPSGEVAPTTAGADTPTLQAKTPGAGLPPGANLIATDGGGTLVFSGSANWEKMIDGDDIRGVQIGEHGGDFGVFAFRDRRPARIGAFTTMVPEASAYNPTAIELSYSSASEDGPFVPIGVFPIRDGRVAPDGRQTYPFPPVVARFLRVKLRPTQGGSPYVMAYEFGALGTMIGK